MQNYSKIIANCPEADAHRLGELVLERYGADGVKLLQEPRLGLVMLQMREGVQHSLFNAGELLVTEVRLELDGQFGYGMVLGNQPRRALAMALVDAALSKNVQSTAWLTTELLRLENDLLQKHRREFALTSLSKVEFEVF